MKLSNQAVGALMMALQRSLMEQTDIVPLLQEMNFVANEEGQLGVTNPPVVSLDGVEVTDTTTLTDDTTTTDTGVLIPEG
tara:strand:- start:3434 stop:3673 length:240 start_codon:yes stop_codon:yes gene_type:complete